MYSHEVTEHFENPRNVGTIADADGSATIGSAASAEMLVLTLKVSDGIVIDAKFRAFGCPTVIASGSVLTEMIVNNSISDVQNITESHISNALGGLPDDKLRFATYAEEVLKNAIVSSFSKQETTQ